MTDADFLKIALAGYVPMVVAFTIAIWQRGQRVKECVGQAEAARTESTQLRGQLAELKAEKTKAIEDLGNKHNAEIKRKEDEIVKLHVRIKELERATDFDGLAKRYHDENYGDDK
jgi:predicted nuclease with TOPRIM domain